MKRLRKGPPEKGARTGPGTFQKFPLDSASRVGLSMRWLRVTLAPCSSLGASAPQDSTGAHVSLGWGELPLLLAKSPG